MPTPLPSPTVLLFDLDGTLVDSQADMVTAWSQVLMAADLTLDDPSELHGIPARASLARLLGPSRSAEVDHWAELLLELECTNTSETFALPGAVELLEHLEANHIAWGVVTSCQRRLATARLLATGLPVPELLITFDDVVKGKPDPEPFLLGATRAGVSPELSWVIEDAVAGIQSGLAAGATVVAVASTHDRAELSAAHHVVADLPELLNIVQQSFSG